MGWHASLLLPQAHFTLFLLKGLQEENKVHVKEEVCIGVNRLAGFRAHQDCGALRA